ncbi:uncharacterized protein MONOS_6675 [Monocercomonoides exilis]|uniref:uncharacterized protein n=1 Tax=Monocercomonoides exilis TaxID=2049356 RepID=UPI0035593D9E|nr:hypothetical protein MONOS_6675 [Monocercomonoides exilis]|eukprot:MONOS_6675.1-p1 / transcript=MONOS_6675.1 / gene=MONOS_6675 / organism=Monocercomonoides_exilis_PA203 / gene_product=unspecified product / transcript_product=unspecified product / location=Mono_scaffold00214:70399-74769(-) / protein_length=1457 / sequence_SO=supercontig / SO=protein_coding / is_pseudo=false
MGALHLLQLSFRCHSIISNQNVFLLFSEENCLYQLSFQENKRRSMSDFSCSQNTNSLNPSNYQLNQKTLTHAPVLNELLSQNTTRSFIVQSEISSRFGVPRRKRFEIASPTSIIFSQHQSSEKRDPEMKYQQYFPCIVEVAMKTLGQTNLDGREHQRITVVSCLDESTFLIGWDDGAISLARLYSHSPFSVEIGGTLEMSQHKQTSSFTPLLVFSTVLNFGEEIVSIQEVTLNEEGSTNAKGELSSLLLAIIGKRGRLGLFSIDISQLVMKTIEPNKKETADSSSDAHAKEITSKIDEGENVLQNEQYKNIHIQNDLYLNTENKISSSSSLTSTFHSASAAPSLSRGRFKSKLAATSLFRPAVPMLAAVSKTTADDSNTGKLGSFQMDLQKQKISMQRGEEKKTEVPSTRSNFSAITSLFENEKNEKNEEKEEKEAEEYDKNEICEDGKISSQRLYLKSDSSQATPAETSLATKQFTFLKKNLVNSLPQFLIKQPSNQSAQSEVSEINKQRPYKFIVEYSLPFQISQIALCSFAGHARQLKALLLLTSDNSLFGLPLFDWEVELRQLLSRSDGKQSFHQQFLQRYKVPVAFFRRMVPICFASGKREWDESDDECSTPHTSSTLESSLSSSSSFSIRPICLFPFSYFGSKLFCIDQKRNNCSVFSISSGVPFIYRSDSGSLFPVPFLFQSLTEFLDRSAPFAISNDSTNFSVRKNMQDSSSMMLSKSLSSASSITSQSTIVNSMFHPHHIIRSHTQLYLDILSPRSPLSKRMAAAEVQSRKLTTQLNSLNYVMTFICAHPSFTVEPEPTLLSFKSNPVFSSFFAENAMQSSAHPSPLSSSNVQSLRSSNFLPQTFLSHQNQQLSFEIPLVLKLTCAKMFYLFYSSTSYSKGSLQATLKDALKEWFSWFVTVSIWTDAISLPPPLLTSISAQQKKQHQSFPFSSFELTGSSLLQKANAQSSFNETHSSRQSTLLQSVTLDLTSMSNQIFFCDRGDTMIIPLIVPVTVPLSFQSLSQIAVSASLRCVCLFQPQISSEAKSRNEYGSASSLVIPKKSNYLTHFFIPLKKDTKSSFSIHAPQCCLDIIELASMIPRTSPEELANDLAEPPLHPSFIAAIQASSPSSPSPSSQLLSPSTSISPTASSASSASSSSSCSSLPTSLFFSPAKQISGQYQDLPFSVDMITTESRISFLFNNILTFLNDKKKSYSQLQTAFSANSNSFLSPYQSERTAQASSAPSPSPSPSSDQNLFAALMSWKASPLWSHSADTKASMLIRLAVIFSSLCSNTSSNASQFIQPAGWSWERSMLNSVIPDIRSTSAPVPFSNLVDAPKNTFSLPHLPLLPSNASSSSHLLTQREPEVFSMSFQMSHLGCSHQFKIQLRFCPRQPLDNTSFSSKDGRDMKKTTLSHYFGVATKEGEANRKVLITLSSNAISDLSLLAAAVASRLKGSQTTTPLQTSK